MKQAKFFSPHLLAVFTPSAKKSSAIIAFLALALIRFYYSITQSDAIDFPTFPLCAVFALGLACFAGVFMYIGRRINMCFVQGES
jgi:hypothetical protein